MRVKTGKLNKWDTKLRLTPQTQRSRSGYAYGTGSVLSVVRPLGSTRKASPSHTKPRISKVVKKSLPVLTLIMSILFVGVAILISALSRMSITIGRWLGKVRIWLISLFWRVTYMLRGTGKVKRYTGKPNSKQTSVWDKVYAYVALVIFAALSIRPEVIPDVLPRIAIVLLASHSIIRHFR